MNKMKIIKRVHPRYENEMLVKFPRLYFIGKYQYIFSNKNGEISLIELPNYINPGETLYEIYCLKGALFDDIERFDTFKEAKDKARKYLKENNKNN